MRTGPAEPGWNESGCKGIVLGRIGNCGRRIARRKRVSQRFVQHLLAKLIFVFRWTLFRVAMAAGLLRFVAYVF